MNANREDRSDSTQAAPPTSPEGWGASGRAAGLASGSLRHAKRVAVALVGLTVLAVGAAMIVLPGPAFVVIPVGLGILATEFVWARRLLQTLKQRAQNVMQRAGRSK